MRIKSLKYNNKTYTNIHKINKILNELNFNWFFDVEAENLNLEIIKGTIVITSGIWFNGVLEFGVIRDIDWRNGIFKNGVIYNGTFKNIIIERGIIFNGNFISGEFNDVDIKNENITLKNIKFKNNKNSIS